MSDLDRWLESAKSTWESWRIQLARLTPGPVVSADQLRAANALARWQAVRTLSRRPDSSLLPELIRLCGDDDELVRAAAVDALVSWGATVSLEPARRALAASPTPAAAISLLFLLARLPDSGNRSAVESWLQAAEPQVRAAAFMALAASCDDADLPLLEDALDRSDIRVQRAIMTTLCAPEAGPLAAKVASAADPILRQRAKQAEPRIRRHLEAKRKAEARGQKGRLDDADTENS